MGNSVAHAVRGRIGSMGREPAHPTCLVKRISQDEGRSTKDERRYPLYAIRYLLLNIFGSAVVEEFLQDSATFISQHPRRHFQTVIQPPIPNNIV